jgi:hypothetical protein
VGWKLESVRRLLLRSRAVCIPVYEKLVTETHHSDPPWNGVLNKVCPPKKKKKKSVHLLLIYQPSLLPS